LIKSTGNPHDRWQATNPAGVAHDIMCDPFSFPISHFPFSRALPQIFHGRVKSGSSCEQPVPQPSVSIVVPAYNAAAHLADCVACIGAQDYANLEIIVADDGSTDSTAEVAAGLARCESRLRVVTHADRANHGVAATRNRAMALAQGEYIWFVDADDRLRPGAVATAIDAARNGDADVVAFNAIETGGGLPDTPVYRQPKPAQQVNGEDWLALVIRQKESRHYVWQRLYRRTYLQTLGLKFREGIVHEDIAWITEGDLRAARFSYVDAVLYEYVRNPASLTRVDSDTTLRHRAESLVQVVRQLQEINQRCAMGQETRRLLQAELVGQGIQVDYLRRRIADGAMREAVSQLLEREHFWRSLWPDAITLTRKRQLLRILLREWWAR
jgi:heptose III glucuronosyltransferase